MKSWIFYLFIFLSLNTFSSEEKLTIQLWHQMIYSHREVLKTIVDDFEKENPNIKVNITYRETEELRSAFQSSAMAGSGPELIYGPSDQVGPFATMGLIRPLDEELDENFLKQY
ncbi:MAG: extracellular solute-binding protein, partial [Bacteriovoracaceae bacterium]|nr:extracellular solute-binding protein [Bacteriovoracaceae bacterium]